MATELAPPTVARQSACWGACLGVGAGRRRTPGLSRRGVARGRGAGGRARPPGARGYVGRPPDGTGRVKGCRCGSCRRRPGRPAGPGPLLCLLVLLRAGPATGRGGTRKRPPGPPRMVDGSGFLAAGVGWAGYLDAHGSAEIGGLSDHLLYFSCINKQWTLMDGSRFFERTGGATFEEPMCRSGAFGTRTEASR